MKYTKYNYKKRKNNDMLKFVSSLLIGVISSCIVGLGVAWVVLKVIPVNDFVQVDIEANSATEISGEVSSQEESEAQLSENISTSEYYFLQCGYFSKKDNAEQVYSKIVSDGKAFIYEEDGKFRVLSGIYNNETINSVLEDFKARGIESVKVTFSLNESDLVEAQVSAICDGYFKILNTTFDEGVESVNTSEFKVWIDTLEVISSQEKSDILEGLKDYIKQLPEELTKKDVAKEFNYLYGVLSNFK